MKKVLLAKILFLLGLTGIIAKLRSLIIKEVRILAYHRIMNLDPNTDYFYDDELISANDDAFQNQISYLKKHFEIIDFKTLHERLNDKSLLTGKEVLITFDDGFADNYSNAFRILKENDVPGVFFISTDYIGSDRTFWFNEVVNAIKTAKTLQFSLGAESIDLPSTSENILNCCSKTLGHLKKLDNQDRLKSIDKLFDELNYERKSEADEIPMTWDNIVEMAKGKMEIGSHTCSHPILSKTDSRTLDRELRESKSCIEKELSQPCQVLAFPVGGKNEYDSRVVEKSKELGYYFSACYEPGTNYLKNLDRFELKRLHVEKEIDIPEFMFMLNFPEAYERK